MDRAKPTFEEFWPEYVLAHQSKLNRTLHVVGMSLALACVVAAIFKRRPSLLVLAPVFAYGFAWAGHFLAEKNLPATFSHPLYSARAGGLLFWKTLCGQMDAEIARALENAAPAEPPAEHPVVGAEVMN
jgi:hypothetical protein